MAISDRINEMYTHVGDVYDTITNVDLPTNKNIQNIPSTMRSSYLEIMNNGIDKIWNNWEKVTGEGETLTLNSTEEAPMKINLKGNTSQEGTPTPESPQAIHVVSGDNSIKVEGKNLLKLDFVTERPTFAGLTFTHTDSTFTLKGTTTGSWTIFNLKEKPLIENGATYTFSANITGTNPSMTISCYFWNKSGQQIDNIRMSKNNNYEITKTINFNGPDDLVYSYATFVIESLTNNSAYDLSAEVQLERNNTKTNFEPYSANSYNIDLPVENLINPSLFTIGGSYNVSSISNGEVVGTSITGYAGVRIALGQNVNLKTNDVIYVRLKIKSDVAGDIFSTIQLFNSSNTVITATSTKLLTPTLTTEYQEYIMKFALGTNDTLNKLFIQHKGSTSNVFTIKDIQVSYVNGSYTPYGTTPIELCDLNTYKDNFLRTSGKNLFDSSITPENYYYDNNGEKVYQSGVEYINQEINNVNYTSITISFLSSTGGASVRVCEYNLSGAFITRTLVNTNNQVVILNNATTKIILSVNSDSNSYFTYLMINKGDTAIDYEPYGSGEWYKCNQLSKYILDGTQSIPLASGTPRRFNASYTTLGITNTKDGASATETQAKYRMCDHFSYTSGKTIWGNYYLHNNWLVILDSESVIADANALKTWLSSNNTKIYYVLATPTYTKITYEPLLEQLEEFYNAKSKNNQTNITQENNDLPFILDVMALKQLN